MRTPCAQLCEARTVPQRQRQRASTLTLHGAARIPRARRCGCLNSALRCTPGPRRPLLVHGWQATAAATPCHPQHAQNSPPPPAARAQRSQLVHLRRLDQRVVLRQPLPLHLFVVKGALVRFRVPALPNTQTSVKLSRLAWITCPWPGDGGPESVAAWRLATTRATYYDSSTPSRQDRPHGPHAAAHNSWHRAPGAPAAEPGRICAPCLKRCRNVGQPA